MANRDCGGPRHGGSQQGRQGWRTAAPPGFSPEGGRGGTRRRSGDGRPKAAYNGGAGNQTGRCSRSQAGTRQHAPGGQLDKWQGREARPPPLAGRRQGGTSYGGSEARVIRQKRRAGGRRRSSLSTQPHLPWRGGTRGRGPPARGANGGSQSWSWTNRTPRRREIRWAKGDRRGRRRQRC